MTESSGRLDPLQSYPAITIPSFLWGNTKGRERKLDQILLNKALEWQGKEMKQSIFHFCQSILRFVLESKANAVCGLDTLYTSTLAAQFHIKYRC